MDTRLASQVFVDIKVKLASTGIKASETPESSSVSGHSPTEKVL